jgi:dTDP-4-amino-4,6-dideoxygalactose transaminase
LLFAFTFTATGDAILRAGATPLFVDIDPATYNINPKKIRHALSSLPSESNVVGILPVHLYGQSCQMDEIMSIAKEYNLFVLEDVAQAFGGMWNGSTGSPQKLGSIRTAGAFSFFPSKPLGGFGDGGMVATDDDEIAELVRMLLKHGRKDKYNVEHIGYNARLDTLQAAILLAKLKYVDEFYERRRKIAEIYTEGLKDLKGLVLPLADKSHVFHQYTLRVDASKRDAFQKHLKENGVSTMIYYPTPLHRMKVFGEGRSKTFGSLEHSEKAALEVFSLPTEPLMKKEDSAYVIDAVRKVFA